MWMGGRPWTEIRVLREGVDASEGTSCGGSQGCFHLPCPKPVEGVQYSSARGVPQWFCEEHALLQVDWDRTLYDEPPRPWTHEFSPEEQREIERILARGRKREKAEPEEIEP